MSPTRLHKAARWYADHGWKVFPLRPRTKEPFGFLGVYNATDDLAQIDQWWTRWPQANVGLHCGGSGLLALDLDEYKDSFAGASFLSRDDEETVTNLTGSGGTHLLYATPAGAKYTNATGNLPSGIDVRGHGGYIVVPPSVHPNGNVYRWEMGYGPHEMAVRPLPEPLRVILDEARAHQRTVGPPDSYAVKAAQRIVEAVIRRMELAALGPMEYERGGRKWILTTCPFNPAENPHGPDKAAYILIAQDGHIAAGCQHARCREALKAAQMGGWKFMLEQSRVAAWAD
jgi:hypothetical protein